MSFAHVPVHDQAEGLSATNVGVLVVAPVLTFLGISVGHLLCILQKLLAHHEMVLVSYCRVLVVNYKRLLKVFFTKERLLPISRVSEVCEPLAVVCVLHLLLWVSRSNHPCVSILEVLALGVDKVENLRYVVVKPVRVHIESAEGAQVVKHLFYSKADHQPHFKSSLEAQGVKVLAPLHTVLFREFRIYFLVQREDQRVINIENQIELALRILFCQLARRQLPLIFEALRK